MTDSEKEVVPLHAGVELLLSRMKSHPEEFDAENGDYGLVSSNKWQRVMAKYWDELTDKEKAVITIGLREARRTNFHSAVMSNILTGAEPERREELPYVIGGTVSGAGVSLRNYQNQMELPGMETHAKHIEAHLAIKQQLEKQRAEKYGDAK